MRRAIRQPLAVVFAVLVVTAGALGTVMLANDDVHTLDEASNQFVQRGAAFNPTDGIILGYAAGAIETYQDFIGNNKPTDDLEKADWQETWVAIYQSHITQGANNEAQLSVIENYLSDSRSIALMQAKKTYVRQLNQGATKGAAETAAFETIRGYYTTKQQNLLTAWNANMQVVNQSLPLIQKDPIYIWKNINDDAPTDVRNTTQTLLDGTTKSAQQFKEADNGNWIGLTSADGRSLGIKAPDNSNLSGEVIINGTRWHDAWTAIQTQNDEAQQSISSFIDSTYDNYQAGELNASDFVDPYLGAREYSPETSNTWTLRTLTSMGVEPPSNLSNIGRMNVTTGGVTYTGVLMSDGTPQSGFSVNETYNTSSITGPQWVALDDGGAQQLDGEFTLDSATRADGPAYTENETITYEQVNYTTANISELKRLNDQITSLQAQINARQQRLRNSGGAGWLPDFGNINLGSVAPVVLIAGGALVLLGRN